MMQITMPYMVAGNATRGRDMTYPDNVLGEFL